MAALIVGFQPILTAAMAGPVLGERTRPLQWIGIATGFIGLMMVLWERIVIDLSHPAALLFAFLSLLGITSATIYQKRFCPSFDLRTGMPSAPPATEPVDVFPVTITDGQVYVDLTPVN